MKVVVQQEKLPIHNHDLTNGGGFNGEGKHGKLLPNTVRAILCGPSNCGKTNAMISLLTEPNGLRFKHVYVYSKSLNQDKYKLLNDILQPMKNIGYFTFTDNADIMEPGLAKPNSIFIFDDIACEKQDNIRSYFSMGRHNDIDCFYLGQTYTKIPKQLIRDNANLLVLFEQDDLNLKHIYEDHVSPIISIQSFRDMCSECWRNQYGFLVINKDAEVHNGRFRKGFDNYIIA
ncbi:hypothetical protein RI129_003047 [Pyrocoelia pectoralis]|uniref:Uncharacterized protein n=1 Tax=Pyrocoelia pectoralis TaxID=417401 RepID=A0AAN7ZIC5_9COLE